MALPSWLQPLPDPAQQRALDAWTIQQGIPGETLMERAGAGMAQIVGVQAPAGPVLVICGKGNNGGDGFVIARLLRKVGRQVAVVALAPAEDLQGDARCNYDRLDGMVSTADDLPHALTMRGLTVVDAILGTGFAGAPHGPAAAAITHINRWRREAPGARVFACDIPSGVDGATGEVSGEAVRADATISFHAGKPGLWIAPGKACAGKIHVVDIGIPSHAPVGDLRIGLISPSVRDGIPRRGSDSTKFAAGAVIVCGGSTGMTGAPTLASEAAMRAGAGYVTACIPGSLNQIFEIKLTEAMTVPLPDRDGGLISEAAGIVIQRAERADALVLGPGIGRTPGAQALARALAPAAPVPLVLDADGLNAWSGALDGLAQRPAATVLTPHAGELARMLTSDSAEIGAHRLASARRAASAANAIVVLKGDDTIVAEPGPDGRVAVSPGGAPALATAGTGDVLSGITGAYLAKRMDPFHAACAAVWIHVLAGRIAANRIGTEGVIAGDVVNAIPAALFT